MCVGGCVCVFGQGGETKGQRLCLCVFEPNLTKVVLLCIKYLASKPII